MQKLKSEEQLLNIEQEKIKKQMSFLKRELKKSQIKPIKI
jgi:hypothetical protein